MTGAGPPLVRTEPPICAAAEAMSADRGDMPIGVIWVLSAGPTVHRRRSPPDWVFDRARVCAQMGVLARGVGVAITGRSRPWHGSVVASLRLAGVQPALARLDPWCSRGTRVLDHDRSGVCPSASAAARVG